MSDIRNLIPLQQDSKGDDLLAALGRAENAIRSHPYPQLRVREEIDEDGRPEPVLWCPRCGDDVDPDDLTALDLAMRQTPAEIVSFETEEIVFMADHGEFGDTLTYLHRGLHGVSLPEGFDEAWS